MANVHGGRLVAQALKRQGVHHVFTLCGGHIQAIYDGCIDEGIRVIDTRHEQTAGHAAEGIARISGVPGVALVTAGPGVTDTVTALANAQRAGVPMICIGGGGPQPLADMGSLQDMDSVTLMRSVSKWSVRVTEPGRLKEYIHSAFRVAQADIPGPVYLEMPLDVLMGFADDREPGPEPSLPARPAPQAAAMKQLASLLKRAQKPMFIVGSQLRWSPRRAAVETFTSRAQIPFFLNGMARGALPPDHPCLFSKTRRQALKEADLVIVLGTPFDFRLDYGRLTTWNPNGKVVQIDLHGAELGRNRHVDLALQADSGLVLDRLARMKSLPTWEPWLSALRAKEDAHCAKMAEEIDQVSDLPNPLQVCAAVGERLGPEDIVIGDGGDFVATAAHTIPIHWPQLWMDPGPFGTLGTGPGYAMAAALSRPEARTVILFGDGAFGLHAMEFEALARQGLPVVAIIGNDAAWTQIRRGQMQLYGETRAIATKLAPTRYDLVVEALGGTGFNVEKTSELDAALDAAFTAARPSVVNVHISGSELRKGAISV